MPLFSIGDAFAGGLLLPRVFRVQRRRRGPAAGCDFIQLPVIDSICPCSWPTVASSVPVFPQLANRVCWETVAHGK